MVNSAIKKHKEPITAMDLAKELGVLESWNTVEMYLYQLKKEGKVKVREISTAYYLLIQ
jgi:predicted ArsR family transcriptional regulator